MFLRTGDMLWGQPGTLLQLLTSVYDPVQLCYYMLIITNSQPRPKPGKGRLSVVKGRRLDSMSQGSSGGGSSWHYTAVSVLAGVGAGCVLGVLGARLLWRKRRPSSRSRSRPVRPQQQQQPSSQESSLVAAIAELTAEVIHLREALRESVLERQLTLGGRAAGGGGGGRPSASVASTEFVSAAEDSIASSDEAFYDVTDVAGVVKGSLEYFDRLGKETLSSEEACVNLSQQIQEKLTETPTDVGLLWRLTRATFHLSMQYKNREDKEGERRLLDQAVEYGQQALEVDDSVWQAHQWFAVAIGSVATFEGTQEKIAKGHQYKEHIDTAISLSPNEPVLHYLRGRWCYEVASLSWLEKKAASALYATPPDSSYEEALQSFLKVEELTPDSWKGNLLMVAKCYIKLYDVPSAVEWLYKAYQLPTANSDDVAAQRETEELLLQHDEDFALDG